MCNFIKERSLVMFDFLKITSYILVLVGALNWGLVGIFNFDLVATIFGDRLKCFSIRHNCLYVSFSKIKFEFV